MLCIARSQVQHLKRQFFESTTRIDLRSDRGECIRIAVFSTSLPCDLEVEFWIVDGDAGFFDIELRNRRDIAEDVHRGRGWLQSATDGERLIVVASNGDRLPGIAVE